MVSSDVLVPLIGDLDVDIKEWAVEKLRHPPLLRQDRRHLLAVGDFPQVQGSAVGEPGEARVAGGEH